jgi:exopolyphosphatase/pppGpp-phosphohydrolase
MRVAAIDIGTNTFHLLIAEKKPGEKIDFIFRKTCVVKLGREGFIDGKISEAVFKEEFMR